MRVSRNPEERSSLPAGCSICKGAPFVIDKDVFGNEVAVRCSCPRGRILRAIDRSRAGQQPKKAAVKSSESGGID